MSSFFIGNTVTNPCCCHDFSDFLLHLFLPESCLLFSICNIFNCKFSGIEKSENFTCLPCQKILEINILILKVPGFTI